MNIKAVRDSKAFYVEPRASEGENTLEELLEIVQERTGREFCDCLQKVMELKTDGKFNETVERLFLKYFVGIKEYVQQSHNDVKIIHFKQSFNSSILSSCVLEIDDSKTF